MDFEVLKRKLKGLVDGSRPLPPPHPQRLSFPNDDEMIAELADIAAHIIENGSRKLRPTEVRHLLFKMAAWCTKRGAATPKQVSGELWDHIPAIDMALTGRRDWLASRAGLGWCIKRHARWQSDMAKFARQSLEKPPLIAETAVPGYSLVELINARQIYAEGVSVGHCMSWSVNEKAWRKHAYPVGDAALKCLTYVIKQRSGELRLFSLRKNDGLAMITIAYRPKDSAVIYLQGRRQYPLPFPHPYSVMLCATMNALGKVVTIKSILCNVDCQRNCPNAVWCRNRPAWRTWALKRAERNAPN